jgi:hypothetical protein
MEMLNILIRHGQMLPSVAVTLLLAMSAINNDANIENMLAAASFALTNTNGLAATKQMDDSGDIMPSLRNQWTAHNSTVTSVMKCRH